jgi:hypothetical protein
VVAICIDEKVENDEIDEFDEIDEIEDSIVGFCLDILDEPVDEIDEIEFCADEVDEIYTFVLAREIFHMLVLENDETQSIICID